MRTIAVILPLIIMTLLSCGKEVEDSKAPPSHFSIDEPPSKAVISKDEKSKIALRNAIIANDITLINQALELNDEIDFHFKDGETPLIKAINQKKIQNFIIAKIIQKSRNINLKNTKGNSPLHLTIKNENFFAFNLLIRRKAHINQADASTFSPLSYALKRKSQRFSIHLIISGADIKSVEKNKISLRHEPSLKKVAKLIKLIKAHHLKPFMLDRNLSYAIRRENINFVEYLLKNFQQYRQLISEKNILIKALKIVKKKSRHQMVMKLLKYGANPNIRKGGVPIIQASIINDSHLVDILIQSRANITATDKKSLTAFDYAAKNLNREIIESLLYSFSLREVSRKSEQAIKKLKRSACKNLPLYYELVQRGESNPDSLDLFDQVNILKKLLNCYGN